MTDTTLRDLRIGLRVLVKDTSFSTLAITVLALGICGVTTMFSVVNGVMLRGFSFPNGPRLVSVNFVDPTTLGNPNGPNGTMAAMDYVDVASMQTSLEMMSAYLNGSTVNVTVEGSPQRYTGAYVTEDFLRILGVQPMLGRDFRADDNQPGAAKVAIIGYGIWQRDFGGTPDAVGRVVRINGTPAQIVGVMPKGFAFPVNEELWIPLFSEFPARPRGDRQAINPAVVGLIKPGVSLDQAVAEFTGYAKRLADAYPETNKRFSSGQVRMLIDAFTPAQLKGTLLTMLGFCVGVLFIACANVMNMQFARATARARELAIRSSLGAGRMRLVRQMLTESLLLSSIGTVAGVGLAYFSVGWLTATVRNLTNPIPAYITFDIDLPVLAVTVLATVVAAVVSGLLPAWSSSRVNHVDMLRDTGRGNTSQRVSLISRGLVVFQIVVTCILLVGSFLQLRSIVQQQTIDFGYDTHGIMSARMGLMDGDYPTPDTRKIFYDRVVERLSASPAYESVALTNRMRMVFSGSGPVEIEGAVYQQDSDRPNANFEQVTGGFFAVTGQKLLSGRTFTGEDLDARQPVAIVNDAFATKHFGGPNAVGRRFRTFAGAGRPPSPWRDVIGVVSTIRMLGPFNNPGLDESGFYVPFYSSFFGPVQPTPTIGQFATLIVKPRGVPADSVATALRRDVQALDPNLPLYFVGTPASQIDGFIAQNRIVATMFSVFGVVAVLLAAVGIYGVMSFSVTQRTQEFGVRMALGADRLSILAMVLRQSSVQMVLGLIAGLGLSLAIAVLGGAGIQGVLFNVSPSDPATYGTVAAIIVVVSLGATLVPARRATRVDPIVALRAD
jgi:putative ABC transport system permease protein